jgi:hypothetical protein
MRFGSPHTLLSNPVIVFARGVCQVSHKLGCIFFNLKPATAAAAAQPATATPSPAATHQQLPGIALLGLQYDSDEDEAEGGTPAAGALAGAKPRQPIGFRALSAEMKSEVRHTQYEARKTNKQEEWFKTYRAWLVKSNDKGAHCKFCIVSLTKPKDKLSTTCWLDGPG